MAAKAAIYDDSRFIGKTVASLRIGGRRTEHASPMSK
jgi:hypothetical protein